MSNDNSLLAEAAHAGEPKSKLAAASRRTFIAIALGLLIAISWLSLLDSPSKSYIDDSLKQALVAYGVARAVNAIVSVLQTIHFLGLGIGEVLDPINDLVERFSNVMELAIVSLFIQKVLLEITSSYFFKVALGVSGLLLIASMYVRIWINTLFVSRVFITLLFLRFSMAAVIGLNGWVSTAFITGKIDADVSVVQEVEMSVPKPDASGSEEALSLAAPAAQPVDAAASEPSTPHLPAAEAERKGMFGHFAEGVKAFTSSTSESAAKLLSAARQAASKWNPKAIKEKLDQVIPQMLNVMALFLLKTLILPLVFLYGLKYALGQVWNIKPVPLYTGKPRLAPAH